MSIETRAGSTARLQPTAGQTVGPFFSYGLEYPGDKELVPPGRDAIQLHGFVYDGEGMPLPDALIEIRQADPSGVVPMVAGNYRRDGHHFTGWGRCGTDPAGEYRFSTLNPGAHREGAPAYFAVTVFARGLLHRLFTRAYLPDDPEALAADPFLSSLTPSDRDTLIASRDGQRSIRFDIHLQGENETVFIRFPREQD
jgi:protocatechuate 3,4-dioxygenase alpha subunit